MSSGSYTRPMGETRKLVTIVFADVSDSTRLGEALDAEAACCDRAGGAVRAALVALGWRELERP